MKRSVLIVTDEMEVGGSQRQIHYILSHIDRSRFDPVLLYFREESWLLSDLKQQGIECIKIPKNGPIDPLFLFLLIRFLQRRKFDVVHAFAFSAELWTAVALIFTKARFISSIRGRYEWYSTKHWKLKGWISRRSDKIVSNSRAGLEYAIEQCSLDRNKAVVINNGIAAAPKHVHSDVLAEQKQSHQFLVGFVGRLVDHKNIECLLRAAEELQKRELAVGLILVGDGPLKGELQESVRQKGLQGVYFLGERNDIHAIFGECDVAVLPSFREGFSNTLLEAMQAGTPMVASKVGGTPEIISDGINGLLFESDNSEELAEKLQTLLKNPTLAREIGEKGKQVANARFSIPHMIEQIQALYEAV